MGSSSSLLQRVCSSARPGIVPPVPRSSHNGTMASDIMPARQGSAERHSADGGSRLFGEALLRPSIVITDSRQDQFGQACFGVQLLWPSDADVPITGRCRNPQPRICGQAFRVTVSASMGAIAV